MKSILGIGLGSVMALLLVVTLGFIGFTKCQGKGPPVSPSKPLDNTP